MFYGSGAGKLPTASAVVADVVDEAKHLHRNIMTNWSSKPLALMDAKDIPGRFFVRMKGNLAEKKEQVETLFGQVEFVIVEELDGEFGFVTPHMTQGQYGEKAAASEGILAMIRIKD